MVRTCEIDTRSNGSIDITEQIEEIVAQSGVQDGIAVVMVPHTTAGITIISSPDPATPEDVNDEISRLVPTRIDFRHQFDTPQDAAGHVKSALVGVSLSLIISEGRLLLGHSQGVYFLEFDGPRNREFKIQIVST